MTRSAHLSVLAAAGRRIAGLAVAATVALALVPGRADAGPYVVFDAASGEVLAENDAFHPWYPASLTKLMTAYVTFKALRDGALDPLSPVVMSAAAAKEPPSKMGFKPGTVITVDTALKILIVKSANDVAVALAEAVGGSEAAFVQRMNAEAGRLGMVGTRFVNPNGLPADGQWTTARDFALLARAILREFPEHRELFRITALSLGGKVIKTHNHLLERYPGTDGMKTGFICSSGFNVVTSATRGGRKLVAVVLGERNARIRAEKTAELLETAFSTRAGLFGKRSTLDALRPDAAVPAVPTDMRAFVCGPNRNAGEDADDAGVATAGALATEPVTYLVPKFSLMDPVPIALGGALGLPPGATQLAPAVPLPRPRPVEAASAAPEAVTGQRIRSTIDLLPPAKPPITILGTPGAGG